MNIPHIKKETLVLGSIALVLIAGASWYFLFKSQRISSFAECAAAGHEVMESYPRKCSGPDGKTFVEKFDFDTNASIEGVAFGKAVNLQDGGFATFEDGLKLSIERFTDSRCPEDVQCLWAGELGVNIRLEDGAAEDILRLVLGAKQNPIGVGYGYAVTLEKMTETIATIRVERP